MRKLARSQLRPVGLRLLQQQGGVCPLCMKPVDLTEKGALVVDHDHTTGQIRGALHRSCNSALGRMDNAIGRWGCKSMAYPDILAWAKRAIAYYEQPATDMIYPSHKTEEELRLERNAKERKARATRKARQVVRKSFAKKED